MLLQQYDNYTDTDHEVWSILYKRQIETVQQAAYMHFITGIEQLGFNDKKIPAFSTINKTLLELTGWQIYAVPGLIDNADFFEAMFHKEFGATTWIRKPKELDYLEEPDMFHDVFGHIPLLTDPIIAKYLHQLAKIAVKYIHISEVIESVARLYWYTIEFGLVRENKTTKIYGAGILSSIGETNYCLSKEATRVAFDLPEIIATPYIKDRFQEKYFVVNSLHQLLDAVNNFEEQLQKQYERIEA